MDNRVETLDTEARFQHFHEKVKLYVAKTKVVINNVYNGKCKLIVQNRNFMTEKDVTECLNDLPIKKCEGYYRIPVCSLYDAQETLITPMAGLFEKIFIQLNM